jgi:hypothetical protein
MADDTKPAPKPDPRDTVVPRDQKTEAPLLEPRASAAPRDIKATGDKKSE